MRADGIWHPRLAEIVAAAGHGDEIVVADPGLPVPAGVEVVDLVWARGEPRFLPVLAAVAGELVVEAAFVAGELTDRHVLGGVEQLLAALEVRRISHSELKERAGTARAVVRTGEATAYANVVLRAGVPF